MTLKSETPPTKFCPTCNVYHLLHYTKNSAGHLSLTVECPLGTYKIKMHSGLNIPIKPSRKLFKRDFQSKQLKLL